MNPNRPNRFLVVDRVLLEGCEARQYAKRYVESDGDRTAGAINVKEVYGES